MDFMLVWRNLWVGGVGFASSKRDTWCISGHMPALSEARDDRWYSWCKLSVLADPCFPLMPIAWWLSLDRNALEGLELCRQKWKIHTKIWKYETKNEFWHLLKKCKPWDWISGEYCEYCEQGSTVCVLLRITVHDHHITNMLMSPNRANIEVPCSGLQWIYLSN